MDKQLPSFMSLAFSPPGIRKKNRESHPNTQFEKWLFSQHNFEHLEYSTQCELAHKFSPEAFPNLRRLKIASMNMKMTRGLVGPRAITHLKVMHFSIPLSRLPPALSNVTVFARDDNDLRLAVPFPKLERIDTEYDGLDLDWFFHNLGYEAKSRKREFAERAPIQSVRARYSR